jgi:hypothetical protein
MKYIQVIYCGKEYIMLHKYPSGFCEIQEKTNQFNIKLVHVSELEQQPGRIDFD